LTGISKVEFCVSRVHTRTRDEDFDQPDNQVVLDPELRSFIEGEVERAMGRLSDRLTRPEVYLSDENADKGGPLTNDA